MVRHVLRRSIASIESSILSLASRPQPARVTTECDRLAKQCVVLARLCSALSLFILPETVELYSSGDRQLWPIDVFQPGVNVKLNAIFCLLWRVTSCWWWGAPHLPNLFSESVLNSAVRGQGSTSILKHLRRREQISRGNANPIDLQSLHGGSWLGRYRIRRRGLVRRSQGGSTYGDDIKLARSFPSFENIRIAAGT